MYSSVASNQEKVFEEFLKKETFGTLLFNSIVHDFVIVLNTGMI